jgi:hypothetical protein
MNKCKNIDTIYNDELNIFYEFLRNKNKCKKHKDKHHKHHKYLTYPYVNKLIDNSNNLTEHKINGLACIVKNIFEQKDTIISDINNDINDIKDIINNIQDQDIEDLQNDVGHLKAFIKLTFNYDI